MEKHTEVVLFKPTAGPDPDACPKCKTHMEPYDGSDIKGRNHKGKFCHKCRWFISLRYDKTKPSRGRMDPNKYGKHEQKFEGRIRPKKRERF